jgi:hypothetical protein
MKRAEPKNVPVQWMRRRKELEAVSGALPIANDCSDMCRRLRDENNDLKAVLAELCRSYEHLEASKAAVDVNILIAKRRV